VIYTDVRGVGCNINSASPFSADALTTEYFSRDVLSIVQVLGLKKYVLYGISYGTVQATVMANIAQQEGIQTPSALVLEGILGNWQINAQNVIGLNTEWARAKALLPTSVADSFSLTPLPLGYSSDDWISFLFTTLNAGSTPSLGNNTVHYLAPLGSSDPAVVDQAKIDIQNKMASIKAGWKPEIVRVATTLWCTETAGSLYKKELVSGATVTTGSDQCPLLGLGFVKPYDSAAYPVTVPIYYFEGSADPDTTPANAAYHFLNQTQADRVFTSITGGGHTAMSGTLHEAGCTPAIFTAIATNPSGTSSNKAVIEACSWPVVVTTRAAGL
jgi:proline iminopeptidase